jgi:tetraacyldisaccharide 4'-kinase
MVSLLSSFSKNNPKLKKDLKHIVLYPLSLLYGLIVDIRNWLFDEKIFHSVGFDIPTIVIGNLAVGGTGKTPHAEFVLSHLQEEWKTAFLSRGYKRKTKGFVLADEKASAATIGDEPFQIFRKFPKVIVAVHEKRVEGVKRLLRLFPDLQLIVLDDAFQHRFLLPGFSVLLTDYSNLYPADFFLPAGSLRESKEGSHRANLIVVTKCPENLKPIDKRIIEMELQPLPYQQVFFSTFRYLDPMPIFPEFASEGWTLSKLRENNPAVLLVTAIASSQSMKDFLKNYVSTLKELSFRDHHNFTKKDFQLIEQEWETLPTENKIIIVTEKDAARLYSNNYLPEMLKPKIFALPVEVKFLFDQESLFIQKLKDYVRENSRNR